MYVQKLNNFQLQTAIFHLARPMFKQEPLKSGQWLERLREQRIYEMWP